MTAWSLLRTLLIAGCAFPIAALVRNQLERRNGRMLRVALLLPFLMPALPVGYAWANSWLSLIHAPWLNELLYSAIVVFRIVPVGAIALWLSAPPRLSAEAAFLRKIRFRALTLKERWQFIAEGPWRSRLPAIGLMFLLAFQEFEVASLMQVDTWTVWLFDAHAGSLRLSETLTRLVVGPGLRIGPLPIQLVVLVPLLRIALLDRTRFGRHGIQVSNARWQQAAVWCYLCVSLGIVCAAPFLLDARKLISGSRAFLYQASQRNGFLTDVGSSLLFAGLGTALAYGLFRWLSSQSPVWYRAILVVLSLPGLMGSLVLSLVLLACFQTRWLHGWYDTPIPLAVCLGLHLLPRMLLLSVVLFAETSDTSRHTTTLLDDSHRAEQRAAAANLRWFLEGSRTFVLIALPVWWAYWNLTAAAILGPQAPLYFGGRAIPLRSAPVLLYNLMHYGRSEVLSAMTLVAVLLPVCVAGALSICCRRIMRMRFAE